MNPVEQVVNLVFHALTLFLQFLIALFTLFISVIQTILSAFS